MNAEELFVLAGDLQFIPVETVHEQTRKNFEYDNTDVILTYTNTRKKSKILGEDLATLLKEFNTPTSWAQAILNFSTANNLDPAQVAEDTYALLKEMQREGFLIAFKEGEENRITETLKPGDNFKSYTVKEILQLLNDTEVYRIEDSAGINYALKLLKQKKNYISSKLKIEADILQKLDGKVNPLFVEAGEHNDMPFLIMEWCAGVNCKQAAQRYRNYNVKDNALKMLDLCIAIVNAYQHLYDHDVLHGDVHAGNIIVNEKNKIKIIDYGSSVTSENVLTQKRAGVDFFYQPEYAIELLKEKYYLPLTVQAEIYSVAALLHLLITDHHYINFSYEKEKLYAQIVNEAPKTFQSYDLNLPASLDNVFVKALSKEPAARFSSFRDFANALIEVRESIFSGNSYFISGKENAEQRFVDYVIKKFGYTSQLIEKGLSFSPTASVNFGAAGIAYMYYRIACVREDASLLDLADIWANRAGDYKLDFNKGFYSTIIDINESFVGKRSIYHSPTGVHLVQAFISYSQGNSAAVQQAIKSFLTAGKTPCDKIDLTLGKASLLVGCALLFNELQPNDHHNLEQIKLFAKEIMQELWTQLDQYGAMYTTSGIKYFGMAHGWAGFLYATLLCSQNCNIPLPHHFENRIEELMTMSIETNEAIRWPVSIINKSSWPGWCHGNAGYIFLLSLLYKHYSDEKFISMAEKAVPFILNTRNTNPNLCCGRTGQSYAFARLYNITGDKKYLTEIEKLKQNIINNIASPTLMNNSLYKGEVGIAILLCESEKIVNAKMPLFE